MEFEIKDEDRLQKIELDCNVFDETMRRIGQIHDMFDHIYISFSGGKDSLLCLKLFELYRKSHGITEKLNVVFYDEELVDTFVLDYVKKLMDSEKYNFQWWCAPLESEKFILGNKEKYIQWDPNREHIRPIPSWAKTCDGVRYQDKMYLEYTKGVSGKICTVVGIRAAESLNRLRGVFQTTNKICYLNSEKGNVTMAKPVYDWSEKDVFKFFYDFKVPYCDTYDRQIFNGESLRVSTPLHAEAAKTSLLAIKTKDPVLYNQILNVFPEVELQVRYYKEFSTQLPKYDAYEHSWQGIIKFTRESVSDDLVDAAIKKVLYCKKFRDKNINKRPFGGFPILYMFEQISKGAYKRMIPAIHTDAVRQKYYDFEKCNN